MLYDIEIISRKNSYHREAVSDLVTALERFFEFGIKSILNHNRDEKWKEIGRQSDRQYRYFLTLYNIEFPEKSFEIDTNKSTFRNKFTHQDFFPEEKGANHYVKYYVDEYHSAHKSFIDKYSFYTDETIGNNLKTTVPTF